MGKRKSENSEEQDHPYPINEYGLSDSDRAQERRLRGAWQVGEPHRRFSDQTYLFWKHKTGRDLTPEDAREITENVVGFFNALLKGVNHG